MLKSHKILSAYLVVNCVGLRTFWMPLVRCSRLVILSIAVAQGRINHCAGCTMEAPPPTPGAPDQQLPNFYYEVLAFERTFTNHKFRGLNVKRNYD